MWIEIMYVNNYSYLQVVWDLNKVFIQNAYIQKLQI